MANLHKRWSRLASCMLSPVSHLLAEEPNVNHCGKRAVVSISGKKVSIAIGL